MTEPFGACRIPLRHPTPCETQGVLGPLSLPRWIVYSRLGRKGKYVYPVVSQRLPVSRNAVRVRGEDEVELLGRAEKIVEVRRVFLVPEYGRNPVGTTVCQQLAQGIVIVGIITDNPVLPPSIIAAPCRLHEETHRPTPLQSFAPVRAGNKLKVHLISQGVLRELVHDGRYDRTVLPGLRDQQRREIYKLGRIEKRIFGDDIRPFGDVGTRSI